MTHSGNMLGIRRVVSGGQTGVDRGALDAAIALGIEHGGWCPLGRAAEDGPIAQRYRLTETESVEYWVRTERNVIDSDGTLILYRQQLSGGTRFTYRMARKHRRPCLLVDLSQNGSTEQVQQWIQQSGIHILNVAGPRESSCRGIGSEARVFIEAILSA